MHDFNCTRADDMNFKLIVVGKIESICFDSYLRCNHGKSPPEFPRASRLNGGVQRKQVCRFRNTINNI